MFQSGVSESIATVHNVRVHEHVCILSSICMVFGQFRREVNSAANHPKILIDGASGHWELRGRVVETGLVKAGACKQAPEPCTGGKSNSASPSNLMLHQKRSPNHHKVGTLHELSQLADKKKPHKRVL